MCLIICNRIREGKQIVKFTTKDLIIKNSRKKEKRTY